MVIKETKLNSKVIQTDMALPGIVLLKASALQTPGPTAVHPRTLKVYCLPGVSLSNMTLIWVKFCVIGGTALLVTVGSCSLASYISMTPFRSDSIIASKVKLRVVSLDSVRIFVGAANGTANNTSTKKP